MWKPSVQCKKVFHRERPLKDVYLRLSQWKNEKSHELLTVDSEVYDVRGWCCVVTHDSILCHALVVALVLPRHGHQLQAVTHPCTLTTKGQFSGQLTNRRCLSGKPRSVTEMLRDNFFINIWRPSMLATPMLMSPLLWFSKDVLIRTQRAAVASGCATNLALF